MKKTEENDKLDKMSLSEAEMLLDQEMSEVEGGDIYYICNCTGNQGGARVL